LPRLTYRNLVTHFKIKFNVFSSLSVDSTCNDIQYTNKTISQAEWWKNCGCCVKSIKLT